MTSRQKLHLRLSDLNRPKHAPWVQHTYEVRSRPHRTHKPRHTHYTVNKRKQSNATNHLVFIGCVFLAVMIAALV